MFVANHLSSNHLLLNFFPLSTLQADVVNIWIETSCKKSVVLLLNLVSFYHKFDSLMVLSVDLVLPLSRPRFKASFINKSKISEPFYLPWQPTMQPQGAERLVQYELL